MSSSTPISSSSSSSSSSSCFAGSETLQLENGATIAMDKVQIGDKVLVASLVDSKSTFYSPVMLIPHLTNSVKATFVHMSTVSGRDVKMTADHLVMSGECGHGTSSLSLVQAASVKVGTCLATVTGEDTVSSVSIVAGEGIYTVVPEKDSLLIVNGILASPFSVNHMLVNAFYNIHRAFLIVPFTLRSNFVTKIVTCFGELMTRAASWRLV
jgi:hypothetical protein